MPTTSEGSISHRESPERSQGFLQQLWKLAITSMAQCAGCGRISLEGNDDRDRVYRRRGQRFDKRMLKKMISYNGGSIMIWAGIMADGRTELVLIPPPGLTGRRYVDEVLRPHVLPLRQRIGERFRLQEDNARPHIANVARQFRAANNIEKLEHPACSPDLNAIQHAWDELKRRLKKLRRKPRNLQELYAAARRIWRRIPLHRSFSAPS